MADLMQALDFSLRVWLVLTGLAVAVHFHFMANFITRAPHWVRALMLPVTTSAGVGMVVCALADEVGAAMLFSALACGSMAAVQLAAWSAGAFVSEQFRRAEKMRQDARWFYRNISDPAFELGDLLRDSDTVPMGERHQDHYL